MKPGYGRNFLIPQGRAVPATEANVAEFEKRRSEYEAKANEVMSAAETRKASLDGASVTIKANASAEGKLFGSVGPRDIAGSAFKCRRQAVEQERSRDGRGSDSPHRRVRDSGSSACGRAHDGEGDRRGGRISFSGTQAERTGASASVFLCAVTVVADPLKRFMVAKVYFCLFCVRRFVR